MMKLKKLATLTLSLSVSLPALITPISAVGDSLLDSIQPGRRVDAPTHLPESAPEPISKPISKPINTISQNTVSQNTNSKDIIPQNTVSQNNSVRDNKESKNEAAANNHLQTDNVTQEISKLAEKPPAQQPLVKMNPPEPIPVTTGLDNKTPKMSSEVVSHTTAANPVSAASTNAAPNKSGSTGTLFGNRSSVNSASSSNNTSSSNPSSSWQPASQATAQTTPPEVLPPPTPVKSSTGLLAQEPEPKRSANNPAPISTLASSATTVKAKEIPPSPSQSQSLVKTADKTKATELKPVTQLTSATPTTSVAATTIAAAPDAAKSGSTSLLNSGTSGISAFDSTTASNSTARTSYPTKSSPKLLVEEPEPKRNASNPAPISELASSSATVEPAQETLSSSQAQADTTTPADNSIETELPIVPIVVEKIVEKPPEKPFEGAIEPLDTDKSWVVVDTSAPSFNTSEDMMVVAASAEGSKSAGGRGIDGKAFIKGIVTQALNYSPEIKNAQASSTAAKYDIDQIKGQRWPQVKVGANSPISNFGGGTRNDNSSGINDTSGSVSMSTTVFDFGKTSNSIQSAEETSNASLQTIKLTHNQIAYETINSLLELDRYQQDIQIAKAYEKRMNDLVHMLSQITETDKGRGSELVQARSKLLQAQTNVQQLESKWRDIQIKLTRLVGHDVKLPGKLQWNDTSVTPSKVLSALDNHPQILRAKAEVQASLHKADAIKSSAYPNINWIVSKSTAKDSYGDESSWYTGVNVEWDLFTGGSNTASQSAAVQRARATQMQFETSVLELKYKIRSMIQTRDSAFTRAKDYRELSAETDRVRTMFYEQWYYLGKRSLLDVLTAENDHFNNQVSAINNQYDAYSANVGIMAESAILLPWLGMASY
ncbi:MAG: TolC family protein [Enterobacteriaceae bacterium]|jgi:adhesin transport system outer membrane protein|nr:TolC family protein [Enterobacteriaceae bacterium]